MSKEVDAGALLSMLNEIDTAALAEGAPLFGQAWEIEKTAMWRKGLAILSFYPQLEEQIDRPGRPRNAVSGQHSFRSVAHMVGRDPTAVSKWVKMVAAIGKTEKELRAWLKASEQPVIEQFQGKLLAVDAGKPIKEKPPAVGDLDFLAVEERVKSGAETAEDVKWLVKRVRALNRIMAKALQAILDLKYGAATELLEKGASEK